MKERMKIRYYSFAPSGRIQKTKKHNEILDKQEKYVMEKIQPLNEKKVLHQFQMICNVETDYYIWIADRETSKKSSTICKAMLKMKKQSFTIEDLLKKAKLNN